MEFTDCPHTEKSVQQNETIFTIFFRRIKEFLKS